MLEEGSITQEQYDSIVTGESKHQAEELIRQGQAGSLIAVLDAESINRLQRIAVEESRLGIPLLIALDVVHGLKTIFPVPLAEAYLSIFSFFLYGMTAIAIGVFISSVTESQVIAAVLGFATLFVGYMMKSICSLISVSENLLTRILGCFDLNTHFNEMLKGTLNLEGVAYYVSLTVIALFLTVQSIQKRRWS